jgi:hypothetical protein
MTRNKRTNLGEDVDGVWSVGLRKCPACHRFIVRLFARRSGALVESYLVRPKVAGRPPVPPEVTDEFSRDYKEACLVLVDSPKASAALSRRCLQHILREKAKVKKQDLSKGIQEVIDSGTLPSHISDSLDAVRHVGNFAAHPIKSQSTGEIVDVEPGEAEWNLDVIEALFDFYLVAPAKTAARKEALNKRLKDAGKPLIR